MYRVVIIDDEPVIVEGLSKSVDWASRDCRVVGTACSGEEGLELIRKERPDIIFSDIRMPGMDGLAMIAAIKSELPGTQITILTGFRDFDYAQKAIQLGVSRFLLKPSKMDELDEALTAMTQTLAKTDTLGSGQKDAETPGLAETEQGEEKDQDAPDSAAGSFIVRKAIAYIEEHYQEKLKLSDVADQVYVSQWHLSKLMNSHMGQGFSEILNTIRINKAKELLQNPALRVGDVAEAVGFLDMAHFSRVFKKQVGISANEYRNTI